MSKKDVKKYMLGVQAQYIEMKNDLEDFTEAFKDGNITEDQLESVKEDIARLEENYKRLLYIDWLYSLPNRPNKKAEFIKKDELVVQYFSDGKADEKAVKAEDVCLLKEIRRKLKELTEKGSSK